MDNELGKSRKKKRRAARKRRKLRIAWAALRAQGKLSPAEHNRLQNAQHAKSKKRKKKARKKRKKIVKYVAGATLAVVGGVIAGGKILKGVKWVGGKVFGGGAKAAAGGVSKAGATLLKGAVAGAIKEKGGGLISPTGNLVATGQDAWDLVDSMAYAAQTKEAVPLPAIDFPEETVNEMEYFPPISNTEFDLAQGIAEKEKKEKKEDIIKKWLPAAVGIYALTKIL